MKKDIQTIQKARLSKRQELSFYWLREKQIKIVIKHSIKYTKNAFFALLDSDISKILRVRAFLRSNSD